MMWSGGPRRLPTCLDPWHLRVLLPYSLPPGKRYSQRLKSFLHLSLPLSFLRPGEGAAEAVAGRVPLGCLGERRGGGVESQPIWKAL